MDKKMDDENLSDQATDQKNFLQIKSIRTSSNDDVNKIV